MGVRGDFYGTPASEIPLLSKRGELKSTPDEFSDGSLEIISDQRR
jgi:hypothetical protein